MISTIDKIKEKLKAKHRNINPETIDLAIKLYFETGKELISSMEKPEVAFVWGTMRSLPKKISNAIQKLEKKDKLSITQEVKLNQLKKLYESGKVRKTGKLSRKYLKYNNEHTN